MLNTLYPPAGVSPPTKFITTAVLEEQRAAFFRYIKGVEKNGPKILENLMKQGARAELEEENGWPIVRETLDRYLRAANGLIEDCTAVIGVDSILQHADADGKKRKGRQVDSGVSWTSSDRPSTASSNRSKSNNKEKALPPSPTLGASTFKSSSALEKLVSGLRRFGTGGGSRKKEDHSDATSTKGETKAEIKGETKGAKRASSDPKEETFMAKSLKKVKSTSALRDRKKSASGSSSGGQIPSFDISDEARRRAISEARQQLLQQRQRSPSSKGGERKKVVSFEA